MEYKKTWAMSTKTSPTLIKNKYTVRKTDLFVFLLDGKIRTMLYKKEKKLYMAYNVNWGTKILEYKTRTCTIDST